MSDSRIPDSSTEWILWHRDTFDRGTPVSKEASGKDILAGLFELWVHVLSESVGDEGNASFSHFYLTWGQETTAERVDVFVAPFDNQALAKLRQWVRRPSASERTPPARALLQTISRLHFGLLLNSARWTATSLNPGAESKQLLIHVMGIEHPRAFQLGKE